eukprot:9424984-Pyramimonas_sp.AAC.1
MIQFLIVLTTDTKDCTNGNHGTTTITMVTITIRITTEDLPCAVFPQIRPDAALHRLRRHTRGGL